MIKKRKKKKRLIGFKTKIKIGIFLLVVLTIVHYINSRVMPVMTKIAESQGINTATTAIDRAVIKVIEDMDLTSDDFYIRPDVDSGQTNTLTANTVLINSLCANIGDEVIKELELVGNRSIVLPLGIITGIDMFANMGPEVIYVSVKPKTSCMVDYDSAFISAGINQINYQVWVNARLTVKIVNPIRESEVDVSRKVALVNAVITGEVPYGMFNPYPYGMPLNTETQN